MHGLRNDGSGWIQAQRTDGAATAYSLLLQPNGGNIGIGTTSPSHKLAVNGTIRAKEIIVDDTGWADYVFADDYRLAPLDQSRPTSRSIGIYRVFRRRLKLQQLAST